MDLEDLYSYHNDPTQLFGSDIYPYKAFKAFVPEWKETLEETGEILNDELKKFIKIMPHRDKEVEKFILSNEYTDDLVLTYAGFVLKGRWKEAEKNLIDDPWPARIYAMFFNFRFKEAEPEIMKWPDQAYHYSVDVLGQRWPEAEEIMKNDPDKWDVWLDYCDEWGIDPES